MTVRHLPAATPILPDWFLEFDLLRGFIWYVSIMFVASILLRLRFYRSIYVVARYVSESCPNVFNLLREHWFICMMNGIVLRAGIYTAILIAYMSFNRFVWPLARISLRQLADPYQEVLIYHLIIIGIMVTIDSVLLFQVSMINVEQITCDLTEADGWLGGRINHFLQVLGKWNPIKKYADTTARDTLRWFNEVTCNSIMSLIAQIIFRLLVAASLFTSYVVLV